MLAMCKILLKHVNSSYKQVSNVLKDAINVLNHARNILGTKYLKNVLKHFRKLQNHKIVVLFLTSLS